MKDAFGAPIRVNGEEGQPAPTPVLKSGKTLNDEGVSGSWTADAIYLSVDNGTTWTQVSGRNGTNGVDGDSFFSDVDTTQEDYVTFILSDGTEVKVARYKALALSFSYTPADGTETTINPARDILTVSLAEDLVIKYGISSNGIEKMNVRVSAFLPFVETGKMTASVDRDAKSITIHTTTDGLGIIPLLITATDNAGHSCTYELTLRTPYKGGDGTEADPYKISSADELASLSELVNGGQNYNGKYFKLTENIDLKGREWKPIGIDFGYSFSGSFDGGRHSISNLNVEIDIMYGGLFGVAEEGIIKNITLLSPRVKAQQQCGALIGMCNKMELVENCYAEDVICHADSMVGGLVGHCIDLIEVKNCHVKNATVRGINHVGGLIAVSTYPFNKTLISKCSATQCTIEASGSWGHGGLISTHYAGTFTLEGCYTTGKIRSGKEGDYSKFGNDVVAGVLLGQGRGHGGEGFNPEVEMTGCYSTMVIESDTPVEKHSLRGEVKGYEYYTWTFSNCYYITSYTGQTPTEGITYQPGIDEKMIQAMNTELGQDIYNTDGTFK